MSGYRTGAVRQAEREGPHAGTCAAPPARHLGRSAQRPRALSVAYLPGSVGRDEVYVVELEVDELPGPDRGLEHEPDDSFVASAAEGGFQPRVFVGDRAGAQASAGAGAGGGKRA